MYKHPITIDGTVIKNVLSVEVERAPRTVTKTTNIKGNYIIDAGDEKCTITIQIGVMAQATVTAIKAALSKVIFSVTFYDSTIGETRASNFIRTDLKPPSPVVHAGAAYYEGMTLTLEEQ